MFAIYTVGGVTGAHINPAVTSGRRDPQGAALEQGRLPYWIAQVLGCFVGAALVFLVYNNAINHFDQVDTHIEGLPADRRGRRLL